MPRLEAPGRARVAGRRFSASAHNLKAELVHSAASEARGEGSCAAHPPSLSHARSEGDGLPLDWNGSAA